MRLYQNPLENLENIVLSSGVLGSPDPIFSMNRLGLKARSILSVYPTHRINFYQNLKKWQGRHFFWLEIVWYTIIVKVTINLTNGHATLSGFEIYNQLFIMDVLF